MPGAAAPGSALAARCTACGTVFRVVPDQLRISAGWVRCGRCAQVFSATDNLIDLDTGVPRRLDLDTASRARGTAAAAAGSAGNAPPSPAFIEARTAAAAEPAAAFATDFTAERAAQPKRGPGAEFREHADLPLDLPLDLPAPHRPEPSFDAAAEAAADPVTTAQPTPSFLRQAERAARWRQPKVRAALATGCVLAAVVLAGQALHAGRDSVAARFPALQPLLAQGCTWLGCSLQAPRRLDQITVESSGLLQAPGESNIYALNIALRNRSAMVLAVPAVELSLTDAQGRLLSRRVLQPEDFGLVTAPAGAALAPGPDLNLQARLQTAPSSTPGEGTPAVVGYTIELFYP